MKRYFIYLSYNGSAYNGWQVQPGKPTIQAELEKALSTVLREDIAVKGAGRTDTGVHASYFVAHFDSDNAAHILDRLVYKLNSLLPHDIAVKRITEVKADAHARFSAISRTYSYVISTKKDPFNIKLRAKIFDKPDIALMNIAAKYMLDYKDFTSFSKLHTDVKTNICNIEFANWKAMDDQIVFEIKADRFLRNMVRAIVGTHLDIGRGKYKPEYIKSIIESMDRSAAGKSVEPNGLYLTDIQYPEDIFI